MSGLLGPKLLHERTAVVSFAIGEMNSSLVAHRLDMEFGISCRAGLEKIAQAKQAIEHIAQGDEG